MKTSQISLSLPALLWITAACEVQPANETQEALVSEESFDESKLYSRSLVESLDMPILKAFSVPDCSQTDELPSNVESASIDIVHVKLRGTAGQWFSNDLSAMPITFDLTQLGCSVWDNFSKFIPPAGTYDHMRLETEESGIVEHADGEEFLLEVPSGEQSGIKIFFNPPLVVEYGKVSVCKFKYDRSKSIQGIPKNDPRSYHFKPVVKAECSDPIDVDEDENESSSSSSSEESSSSSSSSSVCDLEAGNDTDPGYECLSDYELPVEDEPSFILLSPE